MSTIEASIIIPITIGITMLLFWLGVYYYNQNVCNESIAKAVAYGSEHSNMSNEEIEKIVLDELNKNLKDNLVLADDIKMSVSVSYGTITANVHGNIKVPGVFNLGNIYNKSSWTYEGEGSAARLQPSMLLRLIHG